MKSKRRADKSVLCPFYSEEEAQFILCEGVEDNTSLHLAFGSPALLKAYKHRYCCGSRFKKCRIARMLYQKYEEEENPSAAEAVPLAKPQTATPLSASRTSPLTGESPSGKGGFADE